MLDNLQNVDLSGVGGYIRYSYDSTVMSLGSFILSIGLLIFFIFLGIGIYTLLTGTKSQRYKYELEDMYIVGRLKQIAKKDDINLEDELKEFKKSEKRRKLEEKSIISVLKGEIKEKIADVQDKEKKAKK